MKNNMTKALGLGVLAGFAAMSAEAGENSSLLKKLVEKGVITEGEAAVLAEEANNEYNDAAALPSWVQSLTLKGDLRLRYDHTHDNPSGLGGAEDRWRYRFRFGGTANMQNGVKTGFRLASGGTSDIGSTNTTFDGGFARDNFYLDQAWAQMDVSGVTMIGGKNPNFEKTGWFVSKALFDGDITPEGFELHYSTESGSSDVGFHAGAYFVQGEDDPSKTLDLLTMAQITAKTSLSDTTGLTLGLGVYNVEDEGIDETSSRSGNSASGVGYTPVFIDAALSMKTGPGVKLYATYVNNQESSATDDTGLIAGIKFGSAKKAGQWEAKIEYRSLEKDAVWDELTDSDFGAFGANGSVDTYKSGTNVEGTIVQGKYMIYDNVQTALTLLTTESEDGTDGETNNRIQADIIFKF